MSSHTKFKAMASRMVPIENAAVGRILHAVRQHLGTEIAFVSRYLDGGMKELTHVDSDLPLPMGPGFVDPRENSYCWHIAEGRLPELIQDPADHPFTATMAITEFLPVGCHLNTPLRLSDGTLYGSFCCLSRTADRTMTPRDLGILRAFAALAVEQIESTLRIDEQHDRVAEMVDAVIRARSLKTYQQRIVNLGSEAWVGSELLTRFPDAAHRPPNLWFEDAALVGRGVDLELAAIECALEAEAAMPEGLYVSVNASPALILSNRLKPVLAKANPDRIVLEITEHEAIADFGELANALAGLRQSVRIAIDDVGAGNAGLRHIIDLNPDILKLDMSMTRDIHRSRARRAIAAAIVGYAGEIGCRVLAEGIECREERDTLVELGVQYGQGYLFGRPAPIDSIPDRLG